MIAEKCNLGTFGIFLNSLADGIYITDTARKILFWNKAAEQMTGWQAEDIVGCSCFDNILAHEDLSGSRLCGTDTCPLHRAIVCDESSTLPFVVFANSRGGRRIPVEVSVAPIHDKTGNVIGGIESFRDLTPLMQDMEQARKIQQHSMQTDLPSDARVSFSAKNIPMQYVSGDFYRIEQLTPDTYAIFLADVSGHGVAAGLYTMQLRSLWEDARKRLSSPAAFVIHLNEQLFELTRQDDSFATAFYGILDIAKKQLRYVLAGHPAPYLLRDGSVRLLNTHAPAIGLLPVADFQEQTIALQPMDRILIYTDGAIEARNQEDQELGQKGLADLVLGIKDELTDKTLQDLAEFIISYSQHTMLDDDITLMGITFHPNAN